MERMQAAGDAYAREQAVYSDKQAQLQESIEQVGGRRRCVKVQRQGGGGAVGHAAGEPRRPVVCPALPLF